MPPRARHACSGSSRSRLLAPGFAPAASLLASALESREFAVEVALRAGPRAARLVRAVSRTVRSSFDAVLPVVDRALPDRLYICGGVVHTDDLRVAECFNVMSRVWEDLPLMPSGCLSPTLARIGRHLYCCGGQDADEMPSAVASRLDFLAAGAWEALPPMVVPRIGAAAAVLAGCLYVCGGSNHEGIVAVAECFDPVSTVWLRVADMISGRAFHEAAVLDGQLYVCGGQGVGGYPKVLERFDLSRKRWEALPGMLKGRVGAAVLTAGGRLYVCGGCRVATYLNNVEAFHPRGRPTTGGHPSGVWRSLPAMQNRRADAASVVASGGLIVCGGEDGLVALRTVERLNLSQPWVWEALVPLLEARAAAVTVAAPSGLFIFGGFDGERLLASAEHLPAAGSSAWQSLPSMPGGRRAGAKVAMRSTIVSTSAARSRAIGTDQ